MGLPPLSPGALAAACLLAAAAGACALAGDARADASSAGTPQPGAARIEAHSADYVLVGVVHGDALDIHLSRALDNSPVRDATIGVAFRGTLHPTAAQVDGGYELKAAELALPGTTAMEFDITAGGSESRLTGVLQVAAPSGKTETESSGNARQIAWWVLNFAVCGAFLVLWSRRGRKASADDGE
jgi:hypothetical protein